MNRNIRLSLLALLTLGSTTILAQESITPQVLQTLQAQQLSPAEKAVRNALGGTTIQKMSLNQDNRQTPDTYFSVETKNTGISDQQRPMLALHRHQRTAPPGHEASGLQESLLQPRLPLLL